MEATTADYLFSTTWLRIVARLRSQALTRLEFINVRSAL